MVYESSSDVDMGPTAYEMELMSPASRKKALRAMRHWKPPKKKGESAKSGELLFRVLIFSTYILLF